MTHVLHILAPEVAEQRVCGGKPSRSAASLPPRPVMELPGGEDPVLLGQAFLMSFLRECGGVPGKTPAWAGKPRVSPRTRGCCRPLPRVREVFFISLAELDVDERNVFLSVYSTSVTLKPSPSTVETSISSVTKSSTSTRALFEARSALTETTPGRAPRPFSTFAVQWPQCMPSM